MLIFTRLSTMNSNVTLGRPRPLSPHLGIYRWLITSTLSILHRFTGVVLSIGLLYFSAWLISAAYYPKNYSEFIDFALSPLGLLMLFGWSLAFNYHFCNGIRHLIWDTGRGLEVKNVTYSGLLMLATTFIITVLEWMFAWEHIA